MEQILKLRIWQIFSFFVGPLFLNAFILDPILSDIVHILAYVIYFGFYMFAYEFLKQFEKKSDPIKNLLFNILNIGFIMFYGLIIIFFDREDDYTLKGIKAITLVIIYVLAIFYIISTLSKSLSLAEKNSPINSKKNSNYFFLFLLLPIGIWFLIPKFRQLDTLLKYNNQEKESTKNI